MNPYDMWAFCKAAAGIVVAGYAVVAVVSFAFRKVKGVLGGFE